MNLLSVLLAIGGPGLAAIAHRKGAFGPSKPEVTPGVTTPATPAALQVNASRAVLATVDEGGTSRSTTINALGGRRGQAGKPQPKGTRATGNTLGTVLNKMIRNEGPEAFDRKRKAMGPAGSIVTEARPAPKGLPLNVLAASYTTAESQTQAVNGTVQLMDKSPQRRILSPASQPALARGTGFTLK